MGVPEVSFRRGVHPGTLLRSGSALRKLVEHLSTTTSRSSARGGHDYRKVYAAYRRRPSTRVARRSPGQTVKAGPSGPGVEARNITHHAKKLSEPAQDLPRSDRAADPGLESRTPPYYHPVRIQRSPVPRERRRPSAARSRSGSSARSRCRNRRTASTRNSPQVRRRPSRRRWSSVGSCAT